MAPRSRQKSKSPPRRRPKGPTATPTRPRPTPFEKAHKALIDHYGAAKAEGYEDLQASLEKGKKLLDRVVAAVAVSVDEAREYVHWIEDSAGDDDDAAPTINQTAPPSLAANYHREAISILFNESFVVAANEVKKLGPPSPSYQPHVNADPPHGEAERLATIISALIDSVQTIQTESKNAPPELHTPEWLDLLLQFLQALVDGHIGGSDSITTVSNLLELIATDKKNEAGRKILRENVAMHRTLGDLIATSAGAVLSFNLHRVAAATVERNQKILSEITHGWDKDVISKISKLYNEIHSGPRSKPIVCMDLVNTIVKDDALLPPHGFQMTAYCLDGANAIVDERSKRRLESGSTIVYVDCWAITAMTFDEKGLENPHAFPIARVCDFVEKAPGTFSFTVNAKDDSTDNRHVDLGVQPNQAAQFKTCVRNALTVLGRGVREKSSDGSDGDNGSLMAEEDLLFLMQAEADLAKRDAANEEAAKGEVAKEEAAKQESAKQETATYRAPSPASTIVVLNSVDDDTPEQLEEPQSEVQGKGKSSEERASSSKKDTKLLPKTPAAKKPTAFRPPAPVAAKSLPDTDKSNRTNNEANGDDDILVSETPTDPVVPVGTEKKREWATKDGSNGVESAADNLDIPAPSHPPGAGGKNVAQTVNTIAQDEDQSIPPESDSPARSRTARTAGKKVAQKPNATAQEKETPASPQPDPPVSRSRASRATGKAAAQTLKAIAQDDEETPSDRTARSRPSRDAAKKAASKTIVPDEESERVSSQPDSPAPSRSTRAAGKAAAHKAKAMAQEEERDETKNQAFAPQPRRGARSLPANTKASKSTKEVVPASPVVPSEASFQPPANMPSTDNPATVPPSSGLPPSSPPNAVVNTDPPGAEPSLSSRSSSPPEKSAVPEPPRRRTKSAAMRGKEDPPQKKDEYRTPARPTEAENVGPKKPRADNNTQPRLPVASEGTPVPERQGRSSHAPLVESVNEQSVTEPLPDPKPKVAKKPPKSKVPSMPPPKDSAKRKRPMEVEEEDTDSLAEPAPAPVPKKPQPQEATKRQRRAELEEVVEGDVASLAVPAPKVPKKPLLKESKRQPRAEVDVVHSSDLSDAEETQFPWQSKAMRSGANGSRATETKPTKPEKPVKSATPAQREKLDQPHFTPVTKPVKPAETKAAKPSAQSVKRQKPLQDADDVFTDQQSTPSTVYEIEDDTTLVPPDSPPVETSTPKRLLPADAQQSALKRGYEGMEPGRSALKKARFSEPPPPARPPQIPAAQTQVTDLLRQTAEFIADNHFKRLHEPNKHVASVNRHLKNSMAVTATKWWNESDAHVSNIKLAREPFTTMYDKMFTISQHLTAESKKRHSKVRYTVQNPKTGGYLPASLFSE